MPRGDAAALRAVAYAALVFTPSVCGHDEQTVPMEVQAGLRLPGGPAALERRLCEVLAPHGHHVRLAAAPTALDAALLAQSGPRDRGDPALGPHGTQLPALQASIDDVAVWLLGRGREHSEALRGMGLRQLSDRRALPRRGLAARLGAEPLDDLDRALGPQPGPRCWLALPARFESRLELFSAPAAAAERLRAHRNRLVGRRSRARLLAPTTSRRPKTARGCGSTTAAWARRALSPTGICRSVLPE